MGGGRKSSAPAWVRTSGPRSEYTKGILQQANKIGLVYRDLSPVSLRERQRGRMGKRERERICVSQFKVVLLALEIPFALHSSKRLAQFCKGQRVLASFLYFLYCILLSLFKKKNLLSKLGSIFPRESQLRQSCAWPRWK